MSTVETSDFTLLGPLEDGGLSLSLMRLRPRNPPPVESRRERLSLLFGHGTSFHKETWIPAVEHLFELQAQTTDPNATIVEAWLMDAQNHGRAAILNEAKLLLKPEGVSPWELARAMEVVFKSGLLAGTSVVGVAHSASAVALALVTPSREFGKLRHASMILVEPTMMTRPLFAKINKNGKVWEIMSDIARSRKDIWPSREAARKWMATHPPWETWTPRCLDLFVEYALRDLPTATYPDRKDGVTLCCTRVQEAATYTFGGDEGFAAIDRVGEHSKLIPVHVIYGENADVAPEFIRAAFLKAEQAKNLASVTTIPDVGHLVVEEDPAKVAVAIWNVLQDTPQKSRL